MNNQVVERCGASSLEKRADVDDTSDALTQLPDDAVHQGHHALIGVVVAGNDPYHPQTPHQRRNGVQDQAEVHRRGQVLMRNTNTLNAPFPLSRLTELNFNLLNSYFFFILFLCFCVGLGSHF